MKVQTSVPPRWLLKLSSKIHVYLYRRTLGRVWNSMNGLPVLLLTTTGRKTGNPHTVPVVFLKDGLNHVIAPGILERPAWYLNLIANPHGSIQIGRSSSQFEAAVADREERHRLWPMVPAYWEAYRKNAWEELPLVILKLLEREDRIVHGQARPL